MTQSPTARRPISVAIVDDDASVRVSLRRLCQVFGLNAEAYASGHDFLASLADGSARPDCLVLDAHMPQMTGSELLQHLNAAGTCIPTIVCTADDTPEVRARHAAAGFVAYLQKPVGGERLLDAIDEAVRHRSPAD